MTEIRGIFFIMEKEFWKDVPGCDGFYQVSNFGRIKSLKSNIILKPQKEKNGYLRFKLKFGTKFKSVLAHRIVAMAFIPNPENKPQIDHKDGNRINNKADNLCWVTQTENVNNPITRKTFVNKFAFQVIQLKNNEVIEMFDSVTKASKKTNISAHNILQCIKGKKEIAGGYNWIKNNNFTSENSF